MIRKILLYNTFICKVIKSAYVETRELKHCQKQISYEVNQKSLYLPLLPSSIQFHETLDTVKRKKRLFFLSITSHQRRLMYKNVLPQNRDFFVQRQKRTTFCTLVGRLGSGEACILKIKNSDVCLAMRFASVFSSM